MLTTAKPTEKSSLAGSEPLTAEARPAPEEIGLRAYQIYVERGGTDKNRGATRRSRYFAALNTTRPPTIVSVG